MKQTYFGMRRVAWAGLLAAVAAFMFAFAFASTAAAQKVWDRSDVNMRTLLEYDFQIVDTNFLIIPDANQTVEVIYLQKADKLFRCFTYEPQGQAAKHWCENLQ